MQAVDFNGLFETYASDVMRFALYLTGERDAAEEITNETFVRVWLATGPIRAESVKAYLLTIARNLHVARDRARARLGELPPDVVDEAATPERTAADREELHSVLGALQSLPGADRAAVLMRANELSYEAIAEALGLSPAAVRVRVHRARMKLMALRSRS
jgi:RNA polymerase sigma-70 factor, ECF subfamily